eukprot:CAMPEP_0113913722 /NCGR_PEP_ID=MMETSP0780_2-20120614/29776_1 /TAXON_ID=652834 /ORGANISM="Palpitomonas bilix" /LENGTH=314 /DNA_ID=CAMNT_0000911095 /DNA_START=174 /DNA_END=1119 /DNA_ORIENTATION=- /assembly_acc=CAM_ASM_000599
MNDSTAANYLLSSSSSHYYFTSLLSLLSPTPLFSLEDEVRRRRKTQGEVEEDAVESGVRAGEGRAGRRSGGIPSIHAYAYEGRGGGGREGGGREEVEMELSGRGGWKERAVSSNSKKGKEDRTIMGHSHVVNFDQPLHSLFAASSTSSATTSTTTTTSYSMDDRGGRGSSEGMQRQQQRQSGEVYRSMRGSMHSSVHGSVHSREREGEKRKKEERNTASRIGVTHTATPPLPDLSSSSLPLPSPSPHHPSVRMSPPTSPPPPPSPPFTITDVMRAVMTLAEKVDNQHDMMERMARSVEELSVQVSSIKSHLDMK